MGTAGVLVNPGLVMIMDLQHNFLQLLSTTTLGGTTVVYYVSNTTSSVTTNGLAWLHGNRQTV